MDRQLLIYKKNFRMAAIEKDFFRMSELFNLVIDNLQEYKDLVEQKNGKNKRS